MLWQWFLVSVLLVSGKNADCSQKQIKIWSHTNCEAGRTFFARLNRIPKVSSEHVQPYLFPWMVELKVETPEQIKLCTGALINDRYVLSPQSCLFGNRRVTAYLGFPYEYDNGISESIQPKTLEVGVSRIVMHPNFDLHRTETLENNLGLVQLANPVKYSKTIYPIRLPLPGDKFQDYAGMDGEIVEWSFFRNLSPSHKKLKQVPVKMLNAQQCSNFNSNFKQTVTSAMVCTVNVSRGIQPCGEASGGLLTIEKVQRLHNITVLVGITAVVPPLASGCKEPDSLNVYIRIDKKLNWIKQNTRDGKYCRY